MGTKIVIRINNLDKIAAQLKPKLEVAIQKFLFDVDAHATASTPVDTGKLKNSKSVSEHEIRWSAEYAAFVDQGTRYQPAQPFATTAVQQCIPAFKEALESLGGELA